MKSAKQPERRLKTNEIEREKDMLWMDRVKNLQSI